MSDLIERLRDEEYRGSLQHLRSYSDLDKLHDEAADAIAAKDREIAETRQRTIEECAVYHDNKAQNFKVIAETETVKSTAERARLAIVFHEASAAAIRSLGKEGSGE